MSNKIVKIPVKDIDGLRSDGGYLLRYRVKSKDEGLTSDWSELQNVSFPTNINGETLSFYEMYVTNGATRPSLASSSSTNPHASNNPYVVSTVKNGMTDAEYINSTLTVAGTFPERLVTYEWESLSKYPVAQKFDVYVSWKTAAGAWTDWEYVATESKKSVFKEPVTTYTRVQAALFLSSYPKLTDIYRDGEMTFVSIAADIAV